MHYLGSVRALLSVVVYPIQYIVNFPVSASDWMEDSLATEHDVQAENEKLKSQNAFLQAQMQKYVSLEIENMRLRRLLDASERLTDRVLTAELLAVDLDPFSHQVMINKGGRHEVYEGQPILDANGVYGQVVYVSLLSSTVVLITDPGHALPVQVNRSGLRTIAQGTGLVDRLDLLHIPNNGDIREGDMLVTSGLGGVFPPGYPVAVVVEVKPDSSKPFAVVAARPLAELDKSREVLLVWKEKLAPTLAEPAHQPEPESRVQPEVETDPTLELDIETNVEPEPVQTVGGDNG